MSAAIAQVAGMFCAIMFYSLAIGMGAYLGVRLAVYAFPWPKKDTKQ